MKYKTSTPGIKLLCFFVAILVTTQSSCSKLTTPDSSPASSTPDPTAVVVEILEKYKAAIGGPAIDQVKSYHAKGSFAVSLLSESGSYEAWGKDPNKTLSVIRFPRSIVIKKGFDGTTRWVQTPAATVTDETSSEMAGVEQDAEIYRAGKIQNLYERMRLEGRARLQGRDVNVVEGIPARGPTEKLFFDSENGLLLRWDMVRRDKRRGNVFVKVHLEEYREVDGVKVPFYIRFAFESFSLTLTIDELKHNVPIDDAMFTKPGAR
jgi:zinc protease